MTFTHPQAGSGIMWYDSVSARLFVNYSFDKTRTYAAAKSTSGAPPNPWPIILGGVALAAGGVATIIAIAGVTAGVSPLILGVGAVAALIVFTAGGAAWFIDMGAYATEMTTSDASAAHGWRTVTTQFNNDPPISFTTPPPQAGGSPTGGGSGSTPIVAQNFAF
jgi:hypothetical protein